MPTVGEQGWGDLMNTNLSTIDNFLKPITVSGSTYTFTGNHVGNQSGGSISATSISNSGTLTSTGKITANGGIGTTTLTASSTSTFTGKITANGGIGTKALTTTSISNSGTLTQTGTSTFTGKITANGGIGTKALTATSISNSGTLTQTGASTFTGLITANGGIKGNLTSCFGLNKETDKIGAIYFSYETTILNPGSMSYSASASATKTAVANPICNDVVFTCYAAGGNSAAGVRTYLKINDVIVCDTGNQFDTITTKTYSYTLKDGDVLYAWTGCVGSESGSIRGGYVKMECRGFLTSA